MDDSFQPTIDMLLNVSIFLWFGAVCPWYQFAHNSVISLYRLIFLGVLLLLLRRPPVIFAMHKQIHQIEQRRHALYVGFFGPIGVSAIFYLYISLEFLRDITVDGELRPDVRFLMEVIHVVVWFVVVCSIVIHGLTIPMGKLGFYLPRTFSNAVSQQDDEPAPFHVQSSPIGLSQTRGGTPRHRSGASTPRGGGQQFVRQAFRIGRTVIRSHDTHSAGQARAATPMSSRAPLPLSQGASTAPAQSTAQSTAHSPTAQSSQDAVAPPPAPALPAAKERAVRFPDEPDASTEGEVAATEGSHVDGTRGETLDSP